MPITLNGDTGIQTPMYNGTITANAVTPSVNMKSRIINGAMTLNQRAFSGTVTADNTVTLDRWVAFSTNSSKYSVSQSSTAPAGFNNSLLVTSLAATTPAASDYYFLTQWIEGYNIADLGWGTANAKTVTLSFWVQSSLTGTFGGVINGNNTPSYPFTYSIPTANTWTQISVTVAGPTTGTFNTTNGRGVGVNFNLSMGSTYIGTAGAWSSSTFYSATGATQILGTNGATFYLTGVQLEVGSTATSFDYRPIGTELALCQRYYQFSTYASTSYPSSGGYARAYASFPVIMRTAPTMTFTDLGSGGSSIGTGSYTNGYFNTYGSLSSAAAGTFSWVATSEL